MEQICESSQAASHLPLALCLMGPTASGKTDLAMALARHLPVDVISVDSALIYRGMDIGTAKPTAEELAAVPHKLIDIVEPTESYSVARFYDDALAEMNQSVKNGRIPLLVGGTMMYFRVLRDGIAAMPSANQAIRAEINALAEQFGWPHVHELLAEVDPESAQRIKPTDPQRLQRALEVYKVSGKSLTQHWAEQSMSGQVKSVHTGKPEQGDYTESSQGIPPVPFKLLSFAISPLERKELHKRIAMRFHMMLEQGFQDEVERLMARGDLDPGMPSMRCVGYRQMWSYLAGELGYQEMIEKGIVATRQLAKRQLTWLRSWHELTWLETGDKNNLEKILNCFKLAASNNPDS